MKNAALVNEEDLRAWLGYEQQQKIIDWLKQRHIPFHFSRGRVVTTITAIDNFIVGADSQPPPGFEFL